MPGIGWLPIPSSGLLCTDQPASTSSSYAPQAPDWLQQYKPIDVVQHPGET